MPRPLVHKLHRPKAHTRIPYTVYRIPVNPIRVILVTGGNKSRPGMPATAVRRVIASHKKITKKKLVRLLHTDFRCGVGGRRDPKLRPTVRPGRAALPSSNSSLSPNQARILIVLVSVFFFFSSNFIIEI